MIIEALTATPEEGNGSILEIVVACLPPSFTGRAVVVDSWESAVTAETTPVYQFMNSYLQAIEIAHNALNGDQK